MTAKKTEPKIGRPLMGDDAANERIALRVTTAELADFKAAADEKGMKVSAWIRYCCSLVLKRRKG